MKEKLENLLQGRHGNHILPFFWQHGEDDEILLRELHKIYDSGIRAVCVEARPHPHFGREPWFEDLDVILRECKRLGMEFWMLDDRSYPTGTANGLLSSKYPHLGRHAVTERHMDLIGPVRDVGIKVKFWLNDESTLVGIVACRRYPDRADQRMTGEAVDLTDCYDEASGLAFVTLPAGCWRIFVLFDHPVQDQYVDTLRADSVAVLIEAVYEPHWERFKEYFGTTFRGYFSDEPLIMGGCTLPQGSENRAKQNYPWNDNVRKGLEERYGNGWLCALPALWFPSDIAPSLRVAYMETVTRLYESCFGWQLGNWARDHGVSYIGHIVEDNNTDTGFKSGGHFFRALNGQDMAGIDVVLCQILPGMSHNPHAVPCSCYDQVDTDFFHFALAKLAASHAHIQPLKKGRAMCEIFGAYGWAEGTKMMKWLTDHMLVRGINQFVPHAFSPLYPDYNCPPHFYAGGHNPLYRPFGTLMGYMNRVADVLSDGLHHATAALYYHAQAEWSGEDFMFLQRPARVLTENQIDFDIIPEDYLNEAIVENGRLLLNGEAFSVFILPYARALPAAVIGTLAVFAQAGLPVWCVDGIPDMTAEGKFLSEDIKQLFTTVPLAQIARRIREADWQDVTFTGDGGPSLRTYHYSRNEGQVLFLTNESIRDNVAGNIQVSGFEGGTLVRYDAMKNAAWRMEAGKGIPVFIEPYESLMLLFGDVGDVSHLPAYREPQGKWQVASVGEWNISFAEADAYDPARPDFSVFTDTEVTSELYNIVKKRVGFAGFVKYEADLTLSDTAVGIDLGEVGETAWVWIDGAYAGERITPPYRFPVDRSGNVRLTVVTTSHLGYKNQDRAMQDRFSAFIPFEPVGLLGPIRVWEDQSITTVTL